MVLVLGITGGIVPCPTATIIMLLGIGANMILGALYAVGVFSLGMALTLMLIGVLALSSRRYASKILSDAQHQDLRRRHSDGSRLRRRPSQAARRIGLRSFTVFYIYSVVAIS